MTEYSKHTRTIHQWLGPSGEWLEDDAGMRGAIENAERTGCAWRTVVTSEEIYLHAPKESE